MADDNSPVSLLKKRVGGVPVVYLILGVVAVALAVFAWRMPKSDEDTGVQANEDAEVTADMYGTDSDDDPYEGFVANPTPVYQTSTTAATTTVDTNDAWKKRSIEWLSRQGYSASKANEALTLFLNGEAMSYDQGQLRDLAVGEFGWPPENVEPGSTGAKPPTPPIRQGNPPLTHTVKGTTDRTKSALASLYYGNASTQAVDLLRGANYNLPPEPYAVGTQVKIPKYTAPKYYLVQSVQVDTPAEIGKKNGISQAMVKALNPTIKWPAKKGTRVRVG